MQRINVTLDERTLALLRRLGERLGLRDRAAVIRFLAQYAARKERLPQPQEEKEQT